MELYKYKPEAVKELLAEWKSQIPGEDFLSVACKNTAKKLGADKKAYLAFGPYWWSVKRILSDAGYSVGSERHEFMDGKFSQESDELTMTAAWLCMEEIRREYFEGARDFTLTDDGEEVFSLFDADMEA
jgi:hypothetical protein